MNKLLEPARPTIASVNLPTPSVKFVRASNPLDEALLLPLTETPVSDQLLGAIHTRLSGKRITGTTDEIVEAAIAASNHGRA